MDSRDCIKKCKVVIQNDERRREEQRQRSARYRQKKREQTSPPKRKSPEIDEALVAENRALKESLHDCTAANELLFRQLKDAERRLNESPPVVRKQITMVHKRSPTSETMIAGLQEQVNRLNRTASQKDDLITKLKQERAACESVIEAERALSREVLAREKATAKTLLQSTADRLQSEVSKTRELESEMSRLNGTVSFLEDKLDKTNKLIRSLSRRTPRSASPGEKTAMADYKAGLAEIQTWAEATGALTDEIKAAVFGDLTLPEKIDYVFNHLYGLLQKFST